MALTKNITTQTENEFIKNLFGKYNTFDSILYSSINYSANLNDDPTLSFDDKDFLKKAYYKYQNGSLSEGRQQLYRIFKHNEDTYWIYIPRFLGNLTPSLKTRFRAILKPETSVIPYHDPFLSFMGYINSISKNYLSSKIKIAVNGNQVFNSLGSNIFKNSGYIFVDGSQVAVGSSEAAGSNQMALKYNYGNPSTLNFSYGTEPNGGDGFGGLTPIIRKINSTIYRYGSEENVQEKIIQSSLYNQLLKFDAPSQRSRARAGKHVFAYKAPNGGIVDPRYEDVCVIILNKDSVDTGFEIDNIRDALYTAGFQNAMGFDGSDSVFLYENNGKPKVHIEAGVIKDYEIIRSAYAIVK